MNAKTLTREQWLDERKSGLGGSESAAVMGFSQWSSPLDVYQEKLGIGQPKPVTEQMDIGTDGQPLVAQRYEKRTGVKVNLFPTEAPMLCRHPKHPFLIASPDALIGEKKGLELKMVSESSFNAERDGEREWGEDGSDVVPLYYLIQVQHYMFVTGISEWDLAALVGGRALHVYHFEADATLHSGILSACRSFWNDNVLKQVPPASTSTADYARFLGARWQKTSGKFLDVTSQKEVRERIALLQAARKEVAVVSEMLEKAENGVKEIIADADGLEWVEGDAKQRITWKRSKDSLKVDWKALCQKLGATKEQIEAFGTPQPGTRRLLVPRAWSKESEQDE